VPSSRLVSVAEGGATSLPSKRVLTVGLLGPLMVIPGRAGRVPCCVLGVRDVALVG